MTKIELVVFGIPIPQGSMRAFMHPKMKAPIITSDNKKTKPWKQEIAGAADDVMQKRKLSVFEGVPVSVCCHFYFDRPKSLKKSILCKMTKPDIDKLARAVLDALTGTIFKDDAQVVSLLLGKSFDSRPRAEIGVIVSEPDVASTSTPLVLVRP